METLRFPSKTFLLGEYAILQGSNALLLGHGPYFTATHENASQPDCNFHADSPAGIWLKQNPVDVKIRLHDPHGGRGGFGASGAEFLSVWTPEKSVPSVENPRAIFAWSAWEDSRALPGAGSGADILVQAFGVNRQEPFFLEIDPVGRTLKEIYTRKKQGALSLFHTGKKLETRAAEIPQKLPVEELEDMVLRASSCLESGLFEGFAREVNSYAAKLATLGLVAPHTAGALASVGAVAGVSGAKGCGAMGSDVILVVHEEGALLEEWAKENSLSLTCEVSI